MNIKALSPQSQGRRTIIPIALGGVFRVEIIVRLPYGNIVTSARGTGYRARKLGRRYSSVKAATSTVAPDVVPVPAPERHGDLSFAHRTE